MRGLLLSDDRYRMSEDREKDGLQDRSFCSLTSGIRHLKSELRHAMETRRAEALVQNPQASFALRDRFLKMIVLPPRSVIASYSARGSEMDPAPLAEALRALGHRIALPVMAGRDRPLVFRIHSPGEPLVPNAQGIREPDMAAAVVTPDVLLVPLLAFDRRGGRLGAGGGYYDRTLEDLRGRKTVLAIGIGFACQELAAIPVAPHDAVLDRIVTEIQNF